MITTRLVNDYHTVYDNQTVNDYHMVNDYLTVYDNHTVNDCHTVNDYHTVIYKTRHMSV